MAPRQPLLCSLLLATALASQLPARADEIGLDAVAVDVSQFAIVAAPIPGSGRSQLQIYEQLTPSRACFAIKGSAPATVDPLLVNFDFTGICQRYIDSNGYSLRIGNRDLATVYRLSMVREGGDTMLMALPTKPGVGPEVVIGKTRGDAEAFMKLELEPGWTIRRRSWQGRSLGHVYLWRETWPQADGKAIAVDSERPPLSTTGSTAIQPVVQPVIQPVVQPVAQPVVQPVVPASAAPSAKPLF